MGACSRQGESTHNRLTRMWECRLVLQSLPPDIMTRAQQQGLMQEFDYGDWLIFSHRVAVGRANLTDETRVNLGFRRDR